MKRVSTNAVNAWIWTWFVDHVVHPALALLHPQPPPLIFRHQVGGRHQLRQLLGKHHMPTGRQSHIYIARSSWMFRSFLALRSLDVLEWLNDPVNDLLNATSVLEGSITDTLELTEVMMGNNEVTDEKS